MVRILMAHGGNAREGVYPHREATTAHAIAVQRGYDVIVRVIEEEEQKRRDTRSGVRGAPPAADLYRAIETGDVDRVIAMLDENPALVHTRHATFDMSPLHISAHALNARIILALLDRGADPTVRGHHDSTPLDAAAHSWYRFDAQRFAAVAALLLKRGAPMTAAGATALGNADWLRATHAAGDLANPVEPAGGLLRIAATHNHSDVLKLLLDLGFDPDERMRFGEGDEPAVSWGMALQHCVSSGKYEMAEMLLQHGADPNASIYASGDPVFSAYAQKDWKMLALLTRYGGVPNATTAGLFRQTDLARQMLAGEARYRMDGVGGDTLAEQLLWGATCGGDPEIVRMALERVDWPRDDPRWFTALEQPLRTWKHGKSGDDLPPGSYLTCFRLVLERCDPNLRGRTTDEQQFGLTTLHNIVARGDMTPEERVAFATAILDRGGRLDIRDHLLKSTPLGWACRWGQLPLVKLFLDRGADPVEAEAESWATPEAWAKKVKHEAVLAMLQAHGQKPAL